jgi:hypothetical protein
VFRRERARIAGRAAHSTEALVRQLVARADELSPEDQERIRAALPPVDDDAEAGAT